MTFIWKHNRHNGNHETRKKGKRPNTLEKYHIYKISKEGIHMSDIHDETYNPIFEVINNIDSRRHDTQYKT
jgi:hypothetical protein